MALNPYDSPKPAGQIAAPTKVQQSSRLRVFVIVGAVVGTVYGFGFGGSPRAFGPDDPFYLDLLQFASRRLRNGALLAALTASIGGVFGALLGAIISYVVRAVRSPTNNG